MTAGEGGFGAGAVGFTTDGDGATWLDGAAGLGPVRCEAEAEAGRDGGSAIDAGGSGTGTARMGRMSGRSAAFGGVRRASGGVGAVRETLNPPPTGSAADAAMERDAAGSGAAGVSGAATFAGRLLGRDLDRARSKRLRIFSVFTAFGASSVAPSRSVH